MYNKKLSYKKYEMCAAYGVIGTKNNKRVIETINSEKRDL